MPKINRKSFVNLTMTLVQPWFKLHRYEEAQPPVTHGPTLKVVGVFQDEMKFCTSYRNDHCDRNQNKSEYLSIYLYLI